MDLLAVALFLGLVALFAIRAWKAQGRFSAPDRWALITSFATSIATFVVGPLLINWVMMPAALERRRPSSAGGSSSA